MEKLSATLEPTKYLKDFSMNEKEHYSTLTIQIRAKLLQHAPIVVDDITGESEVIPKMKKFNKEEEKDLPMLQECINEVIEQKIP